MCKLRPDGDLSASQRKVKRPDAPKRLLRDGTVQWTMGKAGCQRCGVSIAMQFPPIKRGRCKRESKGGMVYICPDRVTTNLLFTSVENTELP